MTPEHSVRLTYSKEDAPKSYKTKIPKTNGNFPNISYLCAP